MATDIGMIVIYIGIGAGIVYIAGTIGKVIEFFVERRRLRKIRKENKDENDKT